MNQKADGWTTRAVRIKWIAVSAILPLGIDYVSCLLARLLGIESISAVDLGVSLLTTRRCPDVIAKSLVSLESLVPVVSAGVLELLLRGTLDRRLGRRFGYLKRALITGSIWAVVAAVVRYAGWDYRYLPGIPEFVLPLLTISVSIVNCRLKEDSGTPAYGIISAVLVASMALIHQEISNSAGLVSAESISVGLWVLVAEIVIWKSMLTYTERGVSC